MKKAEYDLRITSPETPLTIVEIDRASEVAVGPQWSLGFFDQDYQLVLNQLTQSISITNNRIRSSGLGEVEFLDHSEVHLIEKISGDAVLQWRDLKINASLFGSGRPLSFSIEVTKSPHGTPSEVLIVAYRNESADSDQAFVLVKLTSEEYDALSSTVGSGDDVFVTLRLYRPSGFYERSYSDRTTRDAGESPFFLKLLEPKHFEEVIVPQLGDKQRFIVESTVVDKADYYLGTVREFSLNMRRRYGKLSASIQNAVDDISGGVKENVSESSSLALKQDSLLSIATKAEENLRIIAYLLCGLIVLQAIALFCLLKGH